MLYRIVNGAPVPWSGPTPLSGAPAPNVVGGALSADIENAWSEEQLAAFGLVRQTSLSSVPVPDLISYAAGVRWRIETGGLSSGSVSIPTDRNSQNTIAALAARAASGPSAAVDFKTPSGWLKLEPPHVVAIGDAVAAHVQRCFSAERAIADDISAGKITTTAAVDGDLRWTGAPAANPAPATAPVLTDDAASDANVAAAVQSTMATH